MPPLPQTTTQLVDITVDEWVASLTPEQLTAIDWWVAEGVGINLDLREHGCIPECEIGTHVKRRNMAHLVAQSAAELLPGQELWRGTLIPRQGSWDEQGLTCTSECRQIADRFSSKRAMIWRVANKPLLWRDQTLARIIIGEGVLGVPITPVMPLTRGDTAWVNREREILILPGRMEVVDADDEVVIIRISDCHQPQLSETQVRAA